MNINTKINNFVKKHCKRQQMFLQQQQQQQQSLLKVSINICSNRNKNTNNNNNNKGVCIRALVSRPYHDVMLSST